VASEASRVGNLCSAGRWKNVEADI